VETSKNDSFETRIPHLKILSHLKQASFWTPYGHIGIILVAKHGVGSMQENNHSKQTVDLVDLMITSLREAS
jgi:hypothetical protein